MIPKSFSCSVELTYEQSLCFSVPLFRTIWATSERPRSIRIEPDAKSGLPDAGSGLPDGKSGLPDQKSGLPDEKSGNPDFPSGNPVFKSGNPDFASGNPDFASGSILMPRGRSGVAQIAQNSGTPRWYNVHTNSRRPTCDTRLAEKSWHGLDTLHAGSQWWP